MNKQFTVKVHFDRNTKCYVIRVNGEEIALNHKYENKIGIICSTV